MTKKSEILAKTAALTTVAINALMASQQAQSTLKQAQDEGWADDDSRWDAAWAAADEATTRALDRL